MVKFAPKVVKWAPKVAKWVPKVAKWVGGDVVMVAKWVSGDVVMVAKWVSGEGGELGGEVSINVGGDLGRWRSVLDRKIRRVVCWKRRNGTTSCTMLLAIILPVPRRSNDWLTRNARARRLTLHSRETNHHDHATPSPCQH